MLSRVNDLGVLSGLAEAQRQVDMEHGHNEDLRSERDALTERLTTLEARVMGLDEERTALQADMSSLRGLQRVHEEVV